MALKTCNDPVFGTMIFRDRWCKQENIALFGRIWTVNIVAATFLGKPITVAQQDSYKNFLSAKSLYIATIEDELKRYVNRNISNLAEYWSMARPIADLKELANITEPKTLLFKQTGTTMLLLECEWDNENGVAVKIIPEIAVGRQDLFL